MSVTAQRGTRPSGQSGGATQLRPPDLSPVQITALGFSLVALLASLYLVTHNEAKYALLVAVAPVVAGLILRRPGNGFLLAVAVLLVVPYWYPHVWLIGPVVAAVGLSRGTARVRSHPMDLVVAVVVLILAISWLFHPELQISTRSFVEGTLPFAYYLWARLNVDWTSLYRLQWVLAIAGALAACTVLYEAVRGVAVFVDPQVYQWAGSDALIFRAGGVFGGSPTAATALAVVFLSVLGLYRPRARLLLLVLAVMLAAILATLDRAGVLGLAVGSLAVAVLLPYRRWARVAWVALALLVATFAVTSSSSIMTSLGQSKFVTQGVVRSGTISTRTNLLDDAVHLVADSPSHLLFGRGFEAFESVGTVDSHVAVEPDLWVTQHGPNDDYLRAILEQGLLGLLAVLAWLLGTAFIGVRACLRVPAGSRARLILAGLTGATLCYAAAAAGHDDAHNILALSVASLVTGTLVSVARLTPPQIAASAGP